MADKSNSTTQRHCMVVFAHYPAGETRVQRQAEALINQGIEVDIISLRVLKSRYQPPEEIVNGARVYRPRVTRSSGNIGFAKLILQYLHFFVMAMFMLIRLHLRRRYDVVQVHNLPDFLIFSAWFPKLFGARLILDIHDLMPEFFASRTGKGMDSGLVRLIALQEKLSCAFADHVITVSGLWRQTLIQRGVRPDKVSVVMNVADDRIFNRNVNGDQKSDSDFFDLFYHGAIVQRYGLDLVIQAIARLHEEIPNLRFTIHGGKGGYQETLVQLANQLGVANHVRFSSGLRPMSELPKMIRSMADVGVVPYRRDLFTDGILPTKLMEYTALGIPSIVARTPVIEEYFDETMVEFFNAEDLNNLINSIRKLYEDQERLQTLIRNSDVFNQRYNWAKQSANYHQLVEQLGRK